MSRETRSPSEPNGATCDSVRPLLPAAALGALDPGEAAGVLLHVARCRACRRALDDERDLVDLLPLAVPSRRPPGTLRRRVLASLPPRPALSPRRPRAWLGAVAAALVVALLGANLLLLREMRQVRAALRPPASAAGPAGASAGLDWYYLTGTSLAAGAHGILCRQDDGDLAWLIVEGLPAPPPGRVYQLWLIRQDGRLSGGTFTVDARGRAFMTIWLPAGASPFQALGVTDEPPGGSPQPTGRRYLAGGV